MTHHNQTKELITWFLRLRQGLWHWIDRRGLAGGISPWAQSSTAESWGGLHGLLKDNEPGLVLQNIEPFDISKVISKVEFIAEPNISSDDIRSSDRISVLPENGSASILGSYPSANHESKSQDSGDLHDSKTSAADDHREDSASNEMNEENSHPAFSIEIAEQQASSSVSANKIDGHICDDIKEIDIVVKKSIFTISDKPSSCVAEWVDVDSALFVCSTLNSITQSNRQKRTRYTFDISNCDEIFDILILEKRIRIPTGRVMSSSKELGKCSYCKWHDSFSHNTCDYNIFCQQLQSAIDKGRLKLRDHLNTGGHISHRQIHPKGAINLEGNKICVRPSQAETTKGKNIIIDESREKIKSTVKKLKHTFDEFSTKYNKDNAHTRNKQNQSFWNVKPKLPVWHSSPC
jgi:hypothetical protein